MTLEQARELFANQSREPKVTKHKLYTNTMVYDFRNPSNAFLGDVFIIAPKRIDVQRHRQLLRADTHTVER